MSEPGNAETDQEPVAGSDISKASLSAPVEAAEEEVEEKVTPRATEEKKVTEEPEAPDEYFGSLLPKEKGIPIETARKSMLPVVEGILRQIEQYRDLGKLPPMYEEFWRLCEKGGKIDKGKIETLLKDDDFFVFAFLVTHQEKVLRLAQIKEIQKFVQTGETSFKDQPEPMYELGREAGRFRGLIDGIRERFGGKGSIFGPDLDVASDNLIEHLKGVTREPGVKFEAPVEAPVQLALRQELRDYLDWQGAAPEDIEKFVGLATKAEGDFLRAIGCGREQLKALTAWQEIVYTGGVPSWTVSTTRVQEVLGGLGKEWSNIWADELETLVHDPSVGMSTPSERLRFYSEALEKTMERVFGRGVVKIMAKERFGVSKGEGPISVLESKKTAIEAAGEGEMGKLKGRLGEREAEMERLEEELRGKKGEEEKSLEKRLQGKKEELERALGERTGFKKQEADLRATIGAYEERERELRESIQEREEEYREALDRANRLPTVERREAERDRTNEERRKDEVLKQWQLELSPITEALPGLRKERRDLLEGINKPTVLKREIRGLEGRIGEIEGLIGVEEGEGLRGEIESLKAQIKAELPDEAARKMLQLEILTGNCFKEIDRVLGGSFGSERELLSIDRLTSDTKRREGDRQHSMGYLTWMEHLFHLESRTDYNEAFKAMREFLPERELGQWLKEELGLVANIGRGAAALDAIFAEMRGRDMRTPEINRALYKIMNRIEAKALRMAIK